MKYEKYKAEEFFQDENFRKWILENDPAINYFWEKWLLQNPAKKEEIILARKMVLGLNFKDDQITQDQKEAIWQNIKTQQQQEKEHGKIRSIGSSRSRSSRSFAWYFYRAAAIVFIILTSWILLKEQQEPVLPIEQVKLIEKENPPGQRSRIYLSDGTVVYLNANSKISYQENFEPGQRLVHLSGEAFFQVAKDSLRPFTVMSGELSTTALGTQFNVAAFSGEDVVKINLLEGMVEVKGQTNQQRLILDEKQAVHYKKELQELQKAAFNYAEAIAWKDGILYFKKTTLKQVISQLERWYGVQISVSGSPEKPKVISGRFENESLENVLQSISFPGGFSFEIDGKKVELNYK